MTRVQKLLIVARTLRSLGFTPVFRVMLYRFKKKVNWYAIFAFTKEQPSSELFFSEVEASSKNDLGPGPAFRLLSPPQWHFNPKTHCYADNTKPWWKLDDFDENLGDIKCVWEASRFDWTLHYAQAYLQGEAAALSQLNAWLSDWTHENPIYRGVNWKCGQEAGIRILHLAMTAVLLHQFKASSSLLSLVKQHAKRILPTLHYAMSQDNNHGTSEAAALFIAGSWLLHNGLKEGRHYERLGRKWLENRTARLVESDGTFSQYSTNYHRVFLDTLSMVELWRRKLSLPLFSKEFYQKASLATHWLFSMVDPKSGDAPNIGANDGARLLPLAVCDFRDFRPTVQTAMVLFERKVAYKTHGCWNDVLHWFNVSIPNEQACVPKSELFDKGGFSVLRYGGAMVMLRYPRFKFRPSQADVLHVDFWRHGENILRDGGTYGYNEGERWQNYFSGTEGHNTVQFDEHEQMPRLGRFLFGDWLKTKHRGDIELSASGVEFAVSYEDKHGCVHERKLELRQNALIVRDRIQGFRRKAVLRWRLLPGDWRLENKAVISTHGKLKILSTMPIQEIRLVQGYESRYYLQKGRVPVLEVEVDKAGELTSEYEWIQ